MLRAALLTASRNRTVRRIVETAPVSRDVVRRFVAGTSVADAVVVTSALAADGLRISLDHLGEDTTEAGHADATTKAYVTLLQQLAAHELASVAEVSVKLSAVGQALDVSMARDNAATICTAAAEAGTTVTLDMEDHATTDSTLSTLHELRAEFPWVGAVIQAYLHRSVDDCRELATSGSRVRLCKGAYKEPASVAYQSRLDVDRSYVRCLRVLIEGDGYPMVATHDPRLIAIAERLITESGRAHDSYEFQMLYGIRPKEQRRIAATGARMRVYVPYGDEWYGYLMRRLAERPANVAFFMRALATKG
ncbi:MAG TPA: proline dehydrogenase family protein [Mycobacteriales bacterium]|nr:proline dehydrogenase family protein [Mycobacteriales bacterium]